MSKILEKCFFKYPKPANYEENNPHFKVFDKIPDADFKSSEIEILKNVRIATNSLVFNYFKIVKESCISPEHHQQYQKGYKFFLKFIFPKFNFSRKRFLLITDEWTSNYYHWHAFALKKLVILKEMGILNDDVLLFLPKKYKNYPFVLPSLRAFGVKDEQIVYLKKNSNIKVKELVIFKDSPRQHPEIFEEIRDQVTKKISKNNSEFGERIYISRYQQKWRRVANEDEVVELLKKYGFKRVVTDNMPYEDQVTISSQAKYMVSSHGAGLTNCLFMKEGSAVLEIVPPIPDGRFNRDFYSLSTMTGSKFYCQFCDTEEDSDIDVFHHRHLIVDLNKLEENLKLMLSQ